MCQIWNSFIKVNILIYPLRWYIALSSCYAAFSRIMLHGYITQCTNNSCEAKLVAQLQHFVSKQCMNISGLWDSLIELLVTSWLVRSIHDIYLLWDSQKRQQFISLPWVGHKKITQIMDEIERSKSNQLWRLLHWFWISWVGKKVAKLIADYIESQEHPITYNILKLTVTKAALTELYGIWEVIAEAFEERVVANEQLLWSFQYHRLAQTL